jgi:pSer/pThr/pTyr-binding forkhead associated (FHA) protein
VTVASLNSFVIRAIALGGPEHLPLAGPVLVWEAGQQQQPPMADFNGTQAVGRITRLEPGAPMIIELKKRPGSSGAPLEGISLGRGPKNDVVVPHDSISRFHAVLQQDGTSDLWRIVDAESSNGTWVGALRLRPTVPQWVMDGTRLRLGNVELRFLQPPAFRAYLRAAMGG